MIKKIKIKIILSILFIILFSNYNYASSDTIRNKIVEKGPGTTVFDIIEVTGDSYAEKFSDYLHDTYNKNYSSYAKHGTTIIENKQEILKCIKDKYKCIILSIGVNDHMRQTDLTTFKNTIQEFVNTAKAYNKVLIFHSYMKYPLHRKYDKKYTCKQYDYILHDIAQINNNIHYINTQSWNIKAYQKEDGIHYNEKFYEKLLKKISPLLIDTFNNYEN